MPTAKQQSAQECIVDIVGVLLISLRGGVSKWKAHHTAKFTSESQMSALLLYTGSCTGV